jgi:CRP-like cAMP-binding protein
MRPLEIGETELSRLARLARRVDLFASLTIGQLELILPHILLRGYEEGERVFRQGDIGDACYIVYEGEIAVRIKKSLFRPTQEVARLRSGDFFGEMALIEKGPRTATIICTTPARLFALRAADFQYVLVHNPAFAGEIRAIAARRKILSRFLTDSSPR